MPRPDEEMAENVTILLHLYRGDGFVEYKEGSPEEPSEEYDKIIALGWAKRTDQGGPWKRVSLTPEGEQMVERILGVAQGGLICPS